MQTELLDRQHVERSDDDRYAVGRPGDRVGVVDTCAADAVGPLPVARPVDLGDEDVGEDRLTGEGGAAERDGAGGVADDDGTAAGRRGDVAGVFESGRGALTAHAHSPGDVALATNTSCCRRCGRRARCCRR